MSVWWSPFGRSLRPTEPWKSTSPLAITFSSGNAYVTCPSVCPGVATTSMRRSASMSSSPPSTVCSASWPSYGPRPAIGAWPMMSCRRATSAFGQYTGAPVAFASGATAPTWSISVCVTRIASTLASSCSIAPRSRSGSSPGSTTRALSAPSARRMNVFSWNGPTVKARTSTALPLRARARLALLIAAVELQVHEVAHRDVEHQRDDAEDNRGAQRLVERDGHEGDEERDHHERSGRGAAPRRRLAEAARPRGLLLRLLPLLGARRAARASAVLDDAGGVATVLRASLALRLSHR